jgi:hypothetical protein
MSRVLIASPVRQRPDVLQAFLRSLQELELDGIEAEFAFVDDNDTQPSSDVLHAFQRSAPVRFMPAGSPGPAYVTDDVTHHWTPANMSRVATFKDRFLDVGLSEEFDAVFLVDSDLVLQPGTLKQLLSNEVAICSEIFWTRWEGRDEDLPQVWMHGQYSLFRLARDEFIDVEEQHRRTAEFLAMLRVPGVYEVGGLGACTLIRRDAIARGVSFRPILNLVLSGEDRDFSVHAAARAIPLHVDTHVPPLHLYRPSDLDRVVSFRAAHPPQWRKATGNRLVLSMAVRNEANGFLSEVLQHAATYVDAAVIIDDASTDDTVAICHAALGDLPHDIVSLESSLFADEHRLRRLQWEHTVAAGADWILALDADERFEDAIRDHIRSLVDHTEVDAISFRLYDMWNATQYRNDGLWRAHDLYRIFLVRPVPGMAADWPPAAQHAGRFPPSVDALAQWTSTIRLQHLGWSTEAARQAKYARYRRLDPDARWGSHEQYESILAPSPTLLDF